MKNPYSAGSLTTLITTYLPELAEVNNDIIDKAIKKSLDRNGPYLRWTQENEDDTGYFEADKRNWSTGIPTLSRSLDSFESGLALLAGPPNHGKSTILIQTMKDLIMLNNDVIVIDLSLDDSVNKRFTQLVCNITGLRYSEVSQLSSMNEEKKEIFYSAVDLIKHWMSEGKLVKVPSTFKINLKNKVTNYEANTFNSVYELMEGVRIKFPDKKIVLLLDALPDLEMDDTVEGYQAQEKAVKQLKQGADKFEVMILASAHLKKADAAFGGTLPIKDLISGTKKLEYGASWIGIVIAEHMAEDLTDLQRIYYSTSNADYPVLRVHCVKSKVSELGNVPLYYALNASTCTLHPFTRYEYLSIHEQFVTRAIEVKESKSRR